MENSILIKGDISGIQDFIFNIQSKGAAKALKARSFFIEALGILAEERVRQLFSEAVRIYNGGGNFYLKLEKKHWNATTFGSLQKEMVTALPNLNIAISLAYTEWAGNEEYGQCLARLNKESTRIKLSRYNNVVSASALFKPFSDDDKLKEGDKGEVGKWQARFRDLTSTLSRSNSYTILPANSSDTSLSITADSISIFGWKLKLTESSNSKEEHKINRHIPLWNSELLTRYKELIGNKKENGNPVQMPNSNNIVEFGYLANFAKERTGTDKLGILKLDVDNLGGIFQKVQKQKENKMLSDCLSTFFSKELDILLDKKFSTLARVTENKNKEVRIEYQDRDSYQRIITKYDSVKTYTTVLDNTHKYRDNLYVVFAGGDDCFIIGAWDAVVEFAQLLRARFAEFQQTVVKKQIPHLTAPITLSGSILVVDAHYPVVKFAELAEEYLHTAKTKIAAGDIKDASGKPKKDRVNFLGRVFTWDEFAEMKKVKDTMLEMIVTYGEAKAFLQRIIESFETEEESVWEKTPFNPAVLWRFLYHYRDIRREPYFKGKFYSYFFGAPYGDEIGGIYKKYLYDAFTSGNEYSQALPVAARWTEFLTRKK